METTSADSHLARLAGAIAEPARARMLCCLMDGHARTATELAAVAEVAASTASAHLARLREQRLVELLPQGKHRYFRLAGSEVAAALEGLLVVAGAPRGEFRPSTPPRLRAARTCYDHMAGGAGVALHDSLFGQGWLRAGAPGNDYELTPAGALALESLGLDVAQARDARRRFACACLDWSERRPHLGGALGAACLQLSLRRGWVRQALDGRELSITPKAEREMPELFGLA
ncbi:ArsR/SmtB family transcription factor [Variovorax saccharolyticus]|uniref:ArsR/SmtB family transcription factor n=1 Tax=Variovorax saccharolyticus TaxID=3053516 RepID=UPI0025761939|nr:helix-turn-helix transcriptional regulator [Variovorax sp. J22R187]MDM0017524.1 helix-turn-helix transcriptional regulator [Variovorax sp. J22R187]